MITERFTIRSAMPASAQTVFDWHTRPGALERLSPPWETVRIVERTGTIADGGRVVLEVKAGGMWRRWVAQHYDFVPGKQFCDMQTDGPFAVWKHTHRFIPDSPHRSFLEDDIEYALPFGRLGSLLGGSLVRQKIDRMFRYRHQITAGDLSLHDSYSRSHRLKVAVTGSSGLVGTQLLPLLTTGDHRVTRIVRSDNFESEDAVNWNLEKGTIDAERLEGLDAVVHLAGENIAARRWSPAQKERIRVSRVASTKLLCESLARLRQPPRVLVSSSAIGYYGDRGDTDLTEESGAGVGFLPDVCQQWEAATRPAMDAGIRVVHLRFGIILSPLGGALAQMLTPFRLGVGGTIGSGRQWMSWIGIDDAIGAIHHAIITDAMHGPVNVVAPNPVSNHEFTKTLGKVLGRPTIMPVPNFAAQIAFGEMANDLLLASIRVRPSALHQSIYRFRCSELEATLRHLLGTYAFR